MRGQVTEVYKIYDSRDKELVIPVYQRNYDWKIDNCRQLLDDLAELIATGRRKHFFGAVVGKPDSSWEWVVIDGQQRLTTVSLLMLALSRLIDDGAVEAPDPGLGERLRRNYLLKDQATGDTRFKLKPVKNDARAYRRLFGPESEFIERSNVTANYRYFLTELPKLGLDADQIWDAICRLEVMHLDLEPEDDPQRIFESLNSTGLALSEADKIRNLVLMGLSAKDQEVVYEDFWNRIEVNVGYETDDFLRWYLTAKTSKTPRFDRVYESFKKFAADTGLRGAALLAEVRDYSDCYRRVRAADTGSKAADAKLRKLNILRQDVALPFFMPVIADFRAGALSEGEFVRVIDIIESYMFRRFACDIPTNGLNKVFATLYAELRRIQTPGSRFSDVLAYSLRRREGSGIFPDDQWFAEDFATHNLYKIRSERRQYMFECLENGDSNDVRDIAGRLAEGTLSVEHIMPQTLTEAWRAELGQDATEIHETWLHRIGNLTVTGYNSSYSNSPYEQKRTTENGFAHSPYRLNQEMKESPVWTVEQLRARSERLVREALAYWDYPQTSFVPPKPQLPVEPLGTDTDFKGRDAVRFEYQDAAATVRSWRDLFIRVLTILAENYRDRVFEFATDQDWLVASDRMPVHMKKEWQVVPGLWAYADTNTMTKVVQLRRTFAYLGLDPDDLLITLRADQAPETSQPDQPGILEDSHYANLTKFIDVLEPLEGTAAQPAETSATVTELHTALAEFHMDNAFMKLAQAGTPWMTFDRSQLARADADTLLTFISATYEAQDLGIDPQAVHRAILDGSLLTALRGLASVESTVSA